ncbi:class I SAM-dependent methyltransferase [Bacteroidota bacterium]
MSNKNKILSNEKFFDTAAEYYDSMINFEMGLKRKSSALKSFVDNRMKTAADLGCGTGLDSISLSMNGLAVSGFDISQKMIKQARKNAKVFNTKIIFQQYSIDKIPTSFNNKFDFVTSLGNTLANLEETLLIKALKRIYRILKPGGKALFQILNYDLVLSKGERIVKISSDENYNMIRFYDFFDDHLNFNILSYPKSGIEKHKLITTKIYPHKSTNFKKYLETAGFSQIQFFGNLNKKPFNKESSTDLVISTYK